MPSLVLDAAEGFLFEDPIVEKIELSQHTNQSTQESTIEPETHRMKIGIVGASGYSGEQLVRLLARHREVELAIVTSRRHRGALVEEVLPSLRGQLGGMRYSGADPQALARSEEVDLFFLALPHGAAAEYARSLVEAGKRVIDLSADFRLSSAARYEEFYGDSHPDPDLLSHSILVIPELTGGEWKGHRLIACPGCYPTSVLIPLLPLVSEGIVDSAGIVVNSFSGVSGAGRKVTEFYSFAERSESAVAYGIPKHRHLSEIEEQLSARAREPVVIQFSPHLAPMNRGIATTITVPAAKPGLDDLYDTWRDCFDRSPFVSILPAGTFPDTALVVGSNRIDISATYDPRTGNYVLTSALDNLLKGAGGQAVQIMNLCCGFPETEGLI